MSDYYENIYEVLGVNYDADRKEISRAYRQKSMTAHPDAGGNQEEFSRLNRAYTTAVDAVRRENFGRFGYAGATEHLQEKAETEVSSLFLHFIDEAPTRTDDLIALAKQCFHQASGRHHDLRVRAAAQAETYERRAKRLRRAGGKNFLADALNKAARTAREQQHAAAENMVVLDMATKLLGEFTDESFVPAITGTTTIKSVEEAFARMTAGSGQPFFTGRPFTPGR